MRTSQSRGRGGDPPVANLAPLARWQRHGWLILAVGAAFVVGMPATRLLQTFRGVVLAATADESYVAFELRPPRWVPGPFGPGSIVEKGRGAWRATVVEAKARDMRLMQLYERYSGAYEGVIVRIDPPLAPGQASVAVVDATDGRRLRIPLWAEHLAGAAAGRRLRKASGTWDPVLTGDGAGSAGP